MKLLLFSDIHCDAAAAKRLVALGAEADLAIGAGDFGNMHRGLNVCIDILKDLPCPAVVVPGNNETFDELKHASRPWEKAIVLHGFGTIINETSIYGVGGGIPKTPFGDWSYDFSEAEATNLLSGLLPDSILIVHSPPYGLLDQSSSSDKHLGSKTIRQFLDYRPPQLVVCGHIHASVGTTTHRGIPIINPGPTGVLVELK